MTANRRPARVAARALVATALAAVVFGVTSGVAFAMFGSSASSAGPTVTTKRVFSAARTTSAWIVSDRAGGGGATDSSSPLAFNDARTTTTASIWATTFSAGRYLEFTMNAALPGGIPITSPVFNFSFAGTGAGNACYYFDVRAPGTGTVLATHGSAAAPIGCATSAGASFSTALAELTNSDLVNGVRVRVYEDQSLLTATATNVATVSGTGYAAFVMYPASYTDASSGVAAAAAPWELNAADGVAYRVASNWSNSFSASRYLDFTFPAYLPAAANVTAASFTHTYMDINGVSQCYYIDVIVGGTVIA
ncbi:MAG: hypothetical protein QOE36_1817, partial [Gaiellaceae bacterium]|nr:hypothetical protein [Gaiellaceae bacterium]